MTDHPERQEVPPQPIPFPEGNEIYAAPQTPAEAALHALLQDVLMITDRPSMVAHETGAPSAGAVQSKHLTAPENSAQRVKGHQNIAFRMFSQQSPVLGITTTFTAREKYHLGENGPEEPVEPLRFGLDVAESLEQPGIHVEVVVPSRNFTDDERAMHYERQPEEVEPPHARVRIGDGVNVTQLMNLLRVNVNVLDLHAETTRTLMRDVDTTERFLGALGALTIEGQPADESGVREADFQLSESQMEAATKWLDHLYGGAPTLAA